MVPDPASGRRADAAPLDGLDRAGSICSPARRSRSCPSASSPRSDTCVPVFVLRGDLRDVRIAPVLQPIAGLERPYQPAGDLAEMSVPVDDPGHDDPHRGCGEVRKHGSVSDPSRRTDPRRHRRSWPPPLFARICRSQRREHQRAARRPSPPHHAEERLERLHDAGHDGHCRLRGKKLAGDREASSELPMHLEIYRNRPDVNAVVHAHPPTATGFAVAGIPLTRAVLAEVVTTLGSIPIAEYGTPSTAELPEAVRKYIKAHDGMLLANHGAVTCGQRVSTRTSRWKRSSTSRRSASWRGCSGGSTCCRARKSNGCRGCAACTASRRRPRCAPIRPKPDAVDQALCQVLEAPASPTERLVPDIVGTSTRCCGRRAGTEKFG